jgi:hypothetical protein
VPQVVVGQGGFGSEIDQDELATSIRYGIFPMGIPVPFLKNLSGTPSLPTGWVELNGQTISDADSPYDGKTLPDWNGTNAFVRGNSTSGGSGGAATHSHAVPADESGSGPTDKITGGNTANDYYDLNWQSDSSSSLPPYEDAVWVMRIK